MKLSLKSVRNTLLRKKYIDNVESTSLAKVLTTLDLTALGVGSTLGVGVYVLAGEVAKEYAGPAVVLSFLIAAIASMFAGLCYAEFGARVPKAGSAYIYSFVCVGEFIAFFVGWNLILEYVIGSASVVKGLFTYLDSLLDEKMSSFFEEHMPMDVAELGPYPDFFSLIVVIAFSIALAFGAKESSRLNSIFTLVNLTVVTFVVVSGLWHVNVDNWNIPKEDLPEGEGGEGGFAPYGLNGIVRGAAVCFYGFIGFDCIATAGEEAKTPQKSIPLAVVIALTIIFIAYFSLSTVLTMILPYYLQNTKAPLPYIYEVIGWDEVKWVVSVGAMCGLFSSLLGALFPLPRVIYAMANDGLLFKFLGKTHPKFKTPFWGTILAGTLTGLMACVFELSQLFSMMSIGTLTAYSMVAACVLILRYESNEDDDLEYTLMDAIKQFYNRNLKYSNSLTAQIVIYQVICYCIFCFSLTYLGSTFSEELSNAEGWIIFLVVFFSLLIVATLISISFQPRSTTKLTFQVPLVPWLPGVSILINIYLMVQLDGSTWQNFGIWMIIGFVIYFSYGMWNSVERPKNKNKIKSKNNQETKISTSENVRTSQTSLNNNKNSDEGIEKF